MSTQDQRPASEVFAIIEEPTAQMGPLREMVHKVLAAISGQLVPGATHPVVVEKATGTRVKGSTIALSTRIEGMKADLYELSAREFHNCYLDG